MCARYTFAVSMFTHAQLIYCEQKYCYNGIYPTILKLNGRGVFVHTIIIMWPLLNDV